MIENQRHSAKHIAREDSLTKQVHERFAQAKKRETKQVRLVQLIILLVFFALWEVAARLKWIDVLLFSYPTKVFKLLWDKLLDGSLLPHVGVTVVETIIGFVLGTLFGTALAVIIWWSPFLSRVLDPYIVVLNSMPKVALGPLFIVGLGPGLLSIIATTLSITVIITTLVVYGSFKEVDQNYVKVVSLFGGTKRKVFQKVILPASFPAIVSTLKVNVGLAWIGVIVGEFLVSQMGLGYLIIYGFQVFNFTLVISTLFVIAIVATFMYQIVSNLEKRLTKHR
ncbi:MULTISPECIES: ABC transporter permease [Paenibacillus]|uniref:ABC transporter permease n=1 Tax=Paenibacillus violae TaxID=3077234 RepID=A0ABU3R783_9BACL|nr:MULTISPECIES: ABC transporter permease [Paenibacillus]MDU0200107.1 ABC transporter permease [Paenibacillus sp. PFR10]MEC0270867.1 ABC transporter permease [Paenibacillus anseongense]